MAEIINFEDWRVTRRPNAVPPAGIVDLYDDGPDGLVGIDACVTMTLASDILRVAAAHPGVGMIDLVLLEKGGLISLQAEVPAATAAAIAEVAERAGARILPEAQCS